MSLEWVKDSVRLWRLASTCATSARPGCSARITASRRRAGAARSKPGRGGGEKRDAEACPRAAARCIGPVLADGGRGWPSALASSEETSGPVEVQPADDLRQVSLTCRPRRRPQPCPSPAANARNYLRRETLSRPVRQSRQHQHGMARRQAGRCGEPGEVGDRRSCSMPARRTAVPARSRVCKLARLAASGCAGLGDPGPSGTPAGQKYRGCARRSPGR